MVFWRKVGWGQVAAMVPATWVQGEVEAHHQRQQDQGHHLRSLLLLRSYCSQIITLHHSLSPPLIRLENAKTENVHRNVFRQ